MAGLLEDLLFVGAIPDAVHHRRRIAAEYLVEPLDPDTDVSHERTIWRCLCKRRP